MTMDLQALARHFDPRALYRGQAYFEAGRVIRIEHWPTQLTAQVQGSRESPYQVTVRLPIDDEFIDCDCTCPMGYDCKHVVAVLLAFREDEVAYAADDNPLQQPGERRVTTLAAGTSRRSFIDELGLSAPPTRASVPASTPAAATAERWRLVFTLEVQLASQHAGGDELISIAPALQYVRKDGAFGRVQRYRAELLTEPVEPPAAVLRDRLLSRDGRQDIAHHLELLASAPAVSLWRAGKGTQPVQLLETRRCEVSFLPDLSGAQRGQARFVARLRLRGEQDGVTGSFAPGANMEHKDAAVSMYGDWLLILTADGQLWHRHGSLRTTRLMYELCRPYRTLAATEIEQLRALMDADDATDIELTDSARKIEVVECVPEAILAVAATNPTATVLRLLFTYDGHEIGAGPRGLDSMHAYLSNGPSPTDEDSEQLVLYRRDEAYEARVLGYLRTHLLASGDNMQWHTLRAVTNEFELPVQLGDWLAEQGRDLLEAGFKIRLESGRHVTRGSGQVRLQLQTGIDWFDFHARYEEDGAERDLDLADFDPDVGIARAGGSYLLLGPEDTARLAGYLADGMDQRGRLRVARGNLTVIDELYADVANQQDDELQAVRRTLAQLRGQERLPRLPLPQQFTGRLRPYQQDGFHWLGLLHQLGIGGCLADDMGLGKTVQTLALLQRLAEDRELATTMVVAPVSTIPNWEREIARFTSGLDVLVHLGQGRARKPNALAGHDIILTSYQTMRRDVELLAAVQLEYVILDESQQIKNPATATFRAARVLRARRRLTLTGTPVENRTTELWAQLEFLNPGLLGSLAGFKRRFATPIEKHRDEQTAEQLRQRVQPFILRRNKEEVAPDLPEKEEIEVAVQMGNKQHDAYRELAARLRDQVSNTIANRGMERSRIFILEALLKLRQMALFPDLVADEYARLDSAKLEVVCTMIDEVVQEDHQVLVFSQFVQCLRRIAGALQQSGHGFAYLDGSTPVAERAAQVDAFQNGEHRVFLLSLRAGGLGLNLTAADYVILFDPWWNPAVETQAIDRSHRIGQTKRVIAYRLITSATVEEKMRELQERKRELASTLVTTENQLLGAMSAADVLRLFTPD